MRSRSAGFTIVELLIVVALIALASGVVTLAMRDPAATRLEQEAARLAALLESARTDARASGLAAFWVPQAGDGDVAGSFRFVGLPDSAQLPGNWLSEGVSAEVVGARAVVLGPEPLLPPQRIVLRLREQQLVLSTDGLGPFVVGDDKAGATQ